MVIQNYRDIKQKAEKVLSFTPWDIKKTVLLYGSIPLGLMLILTAIDLLLSCFNTGSGLDGIQLYSMLSSISSFLWTAANIFQIFWSPGILYCALMVLREQNPCPTGLFRGFKKWAPLVRFYLLLMILFMAVGTVLSSVVAIITLPFMPGLMELTAQIPETEAEMLAYMESVTSTELLKVMLPFFVVYLIAILALTIPFLYRSRLATPLILDEERIGARQALRFSLQLTKGSCMQLFRLDLSFWWYYLLSLLCSGIPYLSLLPVFEGWNENLTLLLLTAVQCAATLGVYMLGLMKINTCNAVAYDHLRTVINPDLPQLPEETHG